MGYSRVISSSFERRQFSSLKNLCEHAPIVRLMVDQSNQLLMCGIEILLVKFIIFLSNIKTYNDVQCSYIIS